jgi:hypothetical protein
MLEVTLRIIYAAISPRKVATTHYNHLSVAEFTTSTAQTKLTASSEAQKATDQAPQHQIATRVHIQSEKQTSVTYEIDQKRRHDLGLAQVLPRKIPIQFLILDQLPHSHREEETCQQW